MRHKHLRAALLSSRRKEKGIKWGRRDTPAMRHPPTPASPLSLLAKSSSFLQMLLTLNELSSDITRITFNVCERVCFRKRILLLRLHPSRSILVNVASGDMRRACLYCISVSIQSISRSNALIQVQEFYRLFFFRCHCKKILFQMFWSQFLIFRVS